MNLPKLPTTHAALEDINQKRRLVENVNGLIDGLGLLFGTFTPILIGGTTAGAGTYTLQQGQYLKLGRLVIVQYRVTTTAHTGTGQSAIALPFSVTSTKTEGYFSGAVYSQQQAIAFALAEPNTANLRFYAANPGAVSNVPAGAGDWLGSISYWTD